MMQSIKMRLLLSLALLGFACGEKECKNGECPNPNDACTLFMAESTIPNAGIGVFTTKELHEGELMQPSGEIQVPILEVTWHMGGNKSFYWPLEDYYWIGQNMGMELEADGNDIEAYCPGYDSTANSHLGMVNIARVTPQYDSAGLHRSKDPGAGAITYYHNGTHKISAYVPAGGELFKDYGSNWFIGREDAFGKIPVKRHHRRAQEIVETYLELVEKLGLSEETMQELWDDVVLKSPDIEERGMNALPLAEDLELVAKDGIRAIYTRHANRDIEFLRTHGRCLDNTLPGKSTIKQAGRGLFASRFLPKDTIITGSPLSVVLERQYLYMYGVKQDKKGREVRDLENHVGHQLLLNYCFGHPKSELLLCPYGTYINYINHNQTQANIRIKWTENGLMGHNESYFDQDVIEMKDKKTVLAFDYVALRDIEPGEELFLDYGDEFEEAWNRHVENWDPPEEYKHFADADHFNRVMKDAQLRTKEEQEVDPYPFNLELRCHEKLKTKGWKSVFDEPPEWKINGKGLPCDILARKKNSDGEYVYNIRLEYQRENDDEEMETITLHRNRVPRSVFSFVDTPYTTDMHLEEAFRHEIGIPDDMFPKRWKNRVTDEE